jgi:histidinol-phosphate aminotransferase
MTTATTRPASYAPPTSPYPITLKLDANEGRAPTPALLEAAARGALADVYKYPSTSLLEQALAERLGLDLTNVAVGAGGDDVLFRVCRAYLGPGRSCVLTTPTFEMIPREARATGSTLTEVPWRHGDFPVRAVIDAITPSTGVIFVVTPNNPTGGVATIDDLHAVAAAAPGALLCVDLAYTEYADTDLTAAALEIPNTVVVRTLSKAWGLAGLRAGYAAGPVDTIANIRASGGPFPTSNLSVAIAARWLATGEAYMRETVAITRRERAALASLLRDRGITTPDSQANFVLAELPDADDAWTVAESLARDFAIGVRRYPKETPLGNSLRVTCPCDADAFARLSEALTRTLGDFR